MKSSVALILLALTPAFATGVQAGKGGKTKKSDPVVMTVAGRDVTRSEFEYFYNKNNQQDVAEEKSFDEYVDLFVAYKLKVAEAYSQGVDTMQSYKDELAGYRKQLVEPYMIVEGWADTLLNEVIERQKEEVRASHILIQVGPDDSDARAEAAKRTLDSLRLCIEQGQPFDSLARIYSEDPSAKQNAGDLGYFSTLQMVYPFEQAAFTTPVGQMTAVRSRFGWHLIKVIDRRKSAGDIMPAHIMKMFAREASAEEREALHARMDSIYGVVLGGKDFGEVAQQESDDQYTAGNGGAYPWVNRSARFPEEWLDVAYGLEKGAVSKPFMTQFGWHIIKLLDKRDTPEMDEEQRAQIKQQFARDEDRMSRGREVLVQRLREGYAKDAALRKAGVASWTDQQVLDHHDQHLADEEPDFAHLYQEYHDGLMLFEVSGKAVWDKAQQDTAGLEAYFERNRQKYAWDQPRFKGAFIECADDEALVAKLRDIYDHHDYLEAAELVRREVLTDTLLTPDPKKPRFHIVNGLYNPGDNATVDQQQLHLDGAQPVPKTTMPVQMTYGRVLADGPEQAADIRGQVVSDYQDELEQQWVEQLRQKFEVSIDHKQLDALRAQYEQH